MPATHLPHVQRALVVSANGGDDGTLAATLTTSSLSGFAEQFEVWAPPPGHYGENWVAAILQGLQRLQASGSTALLVPTPQTDDPMRYACSLAGLEAARRSGTELSLMTYGRDMGSHDTLDPKRLDDELLRLFQGAHRKPLVAAPGTTSTGAPLVSVVIRSTDRPSLAAALDSVALQTYRHIEVVVVNALGARHRTLPDRCGDFSLRVVGHGDGWSLGRAQAAQLGIEQARGEYLIFLDDDDLLLPDHLHKLSAALQAQPGAIAAHTGVALGHWQGSTWQTLHTFADDFDAIRLRFENYLPIHAVLFRRCAIGAAEFDVRLEVFEDWDFWLQLSHSGAFVRAPGVSARYVASGVQGSHVFEDTAVAKSCRSMLYEKWRGRDTPAQHAALLERLQSLHRSASAAQAALSHARAGQQMLREHAAALQDIVAARETDLANALGELSARNKTVADAQLHCTELHRLVAARDGEIANALIYIADLRRVLAARDEEIAAFRRAPLRQALRRGLTRRRHDSR